MRLLRRTLLGLAACLVLLAAAAAGMVWWTVPPTHGEAAIAGLSAPVHIGIDADGVPRIAAQTATDGAAALGYVHARDRLFQMDLMRRVASGRLSEWVGSATLPLDRTMRTLGLRRRAEADLAGLDPQTGAMLTAYASGVNAWIATHGRFGAPEFLALGTPEPWTQVDSLLWGKTMALYLAGNWRIKLVLNGLLPRLSPERLKSLWPAQDTPLAPAASLVPSTRLASLVPAFPAPFTLPSSASNEWAVDGAHSQTGAPLLAGDPHLGYGMPGIWYLARIDTPGAVLVGATAPGIPFLVIGHNKSLAWTFTTTGADTQDVFVETPVPDSDSYVTPAGPQAFEHHEELIHVRGGADEVLHVRETRHGPVLSDLDAPRGPVLAIAMASLAPHDTAAAGLLALNRAQTVAQAGKTAAQIVAPVQNLLIADRQGIGQFTTGRIPLRAHGDGSLPVEGADGVHDWTGFATGDALPHVVDPPSGHLVNANERVAPPDFPVFMGRDWFGDWRAQRIRTLLDAHTSHTVESFAGMQLDTIDAFAQSILPRLLQTHPANETSAAGLSLLQRWDGWMRTDRPEPLLFSEWMRRFYAALLARDSIPPLVAGAPADVIAAALGAQSAAWCGTLCDTMLSNTLAETTAEFDRDVKWGDLHQAEFAHPLLGRIPLIGRLFTWHVAQPGDSTTIFAGGTFAPEWTSVHGPSYRGVYDLADLDRSLFALAPGQSGNPFRALAGNLIHRWVSGTTIKLGPTARELESIDLHPG